MSANVVRSANVGPPKLSLIVATIGRAEQLRRLFTSLVAECSQDFEVLVVDQSHNDDVVGPLIQEFSGRLRLTYLRDGGRGLSRARNIGLRQARGAYIGFPDDDCWYNGSAVDSVIAFFDRNPDIGIYSGIYTEPGRKNPNFPMKPCELSPRNLWGRACSVGLFLKREALGGCSLLFDERIGAGTDMPIGEEIDLMMCLLLTGVRGYYDPSLIIYHAIHREKMFSQASNVAVRKAFWYVVGKNYRPFLSEAKLARGVAACFLRRSPYGIGTDLSAVLAGFGEGLRARRSLTGAATGS